MTARGAFHSAARTILFESAPAGLLFLSAGCALAAALGLFNGPAWLAPAAACIALAYPGFVALNERRLRGELEGLKQRCDKLSANLERDPLTGLMNRLAFNAALDDLRKLDAGSGEVMILFFDLDRFKDVNDTLGHRVGDQLLIHFSRRARTVLEGASAFARLGGDEFAAILPSGDSRRPQDYGDAIVEVTNEPFLIDGHNVQVAASVGIAIGDALLDDGHELLRNADTAMYEAKGTPRGGCRIYDELLSGRQRQEASIRVALDKSLAEKAFSLHFQPIIDARSGRLKSAESLLRAQSPELADVPTDLLISVAEKSGQIIELTEWTLDAALQAIRALETSPVAVNISPVYFRHPDFVHRIIDRLLASKTRPELLIIEVTEGVLIADIAAARHSIDRLRDIGVNVYLDDFGTCYSSLSYLQHFELDGLKLDKSFLRNCGDKKKANRVIKSVIDFGHSLDMQVVVEGVESDWQARLLQLLGCDYLQGYEFGAAMPLEDLRELRDRQLIEQPSPLDSPEGNAAAAALRSAYKAG